MTWLSIIKGFWHSLFIAVGQLFTWLNRREVRKNEEEVRDRISRNMAAAAKPNQENADRLNRWFALGRSHRVRDDH